MQNYDRIEEFSGALIQHGSFNSRIYLMNIGRADPKNLVLELIALARDKGYTKIFAKLPVSGASAFSEAGFVEEARIPAFYRASEDARFMGFYLDASRGRESDARQLDDVLSKARSRKNSSRIRALPEDCVLRSCGKGDVDDMVAIYRKVFATYPFPIHEPEYLLRTMDRHVDYFGVEFRGQLVALSSAEVDIESQNAELTDFATLPKWRGHGFACHLLGRMEDSLAARDIRLAYTIARAVSPGMNITFSKLGYAFGGRLVNNTNISGRIESMNVWYKEM